MQKKNIIFFPFHDLKKWDKEGYRTRDSHIFSELIKREDVNKVFLINRPTSIYENYLKNIPKVLGNNIIIKKNNDYTISKMGDKVFVIDFHPKDILFPLIENKDWWTRAYNSEEFFQRLVESFNHLNVYKIDAIYSNVVNNYLVVKSLKEKFHSKLIFDIVDDQSRIAKNKKYKNSLNTGYKIYADTASTIIGTSVSMEKKIDRDIIEIPNGVDIQHFNKTGLINVRKKLNIPLDKKIVIYTGKIHDRIDYSLVEEMASSIHEAVFVFCGPILNKKKFKEVLKRNPNIYWFGDLHYDLLPLAIKEADICIIPHLDNEITKSQSPLKLLEYIASGKPVVTTNINGVDRSIIDDVFIENENEKFIEKVKTLINKKHKMKSSIPKSEYWEHKVSLLMKYM